MQSVFVDDQELIIEDVDFCDSYLVLIVREGRKYRLCSVSLPLSTAKVILFFDLLKSLQFLYLCYWPLLLYLVSIHVVLTRYLILFIFTTVSLPYN